MARPLNVEALHDLLGQLINDGHGHRELRFVYQENYPLQDRVDAVVVPTLPPPPHEADIAAAMACGDAETREEAIEGLMAEANVWDVHNMEYIYLVSGGQDPANPYGPPAAFEHENHYDG